VASRLAEVGCVFSETSFLALLFLEVLGGGDLRRGDVGQEGEFVSFLERSLFPSNTPSRLAVCRCDWSARWRADAERPVVTARLGFAVVDLWGIWDGLFCCPCIDSFSGFVWDWTEDSDGGVTSVDVSCEVKSTIAILCALDRTFER
jgi:hypothetical protein